MVEDTSTHYAEQLARGDPVDLRPTCGERVNAGDGNAWDSGRVIEAVLLMTLLTVPVGATRWTHRPLRLAGARIAGALNLEAATLTRPLHLEDCSLELPIKLNDAEVITIRLTGCHLPGLDGHSLHTRGDLLLNDGFVASSKVALNGAHIGGTLNCDASTFTNAGGLALEANHLTAKGNIWLENAKITGEVRLIGAHIGGQLNCAGGTFTNHGGTALNADGLIVDGDVLCGDQFVATGMVRLPGAHIGGQLNCSGGTFTNHGRTAIAADRLIVDGSLLCRDSFVATGEVRLGGARIGGLVNCSGGTFTNPNGKAIVLDQAEVAKEIFFRPANLTGIISLRFASAGAWYDSAATWPANGSLQLLGFSYAAIDADPTITVRRRLNWLRRDADGFSPQPYEQLANVYRRHGREHDARTVQISAQWQRRWAKSPLWPFRVAWSALLWVTIGYGYRPWQVLGPIGVLYTFGWWWFTRAERDGEVIRAKDLDPEVHFDGARYTADLLIPGASLGERARFLPIDDTAWWATGYTLAGWALAAMLIAGLTGVFRRH